MGSYCVITNDRLVNYIQDASNRISTLVNAVITYSNMDKSLEKENTYLQPGIKSTLAILNHKKKENFAIKWKLKLLLTSRICHKRSMA